MDASQRCELESGESDTLILARLDAFGECRALSQRRRVQEVRSGLVMAIFRGASQLSREPVSLAAASNEASRRGLDFDLSIYMGYI